MIILEKALQAITGLFLSPTIFTMQFPDIGEEQLEVEDGADVTGWKNHRGTLDSQEELPILA